MKSMTGYGAAEGSVGKGRIFVEIRSVNHRFSELFFRIPPKFNVLEPRLRKMIQTQLQRGKVDCFIKEYAPVEPAPRVIVNVELAKTYARAMKMVAKELREPTRPLLDVVPLRDFVRFEEVHVRYDRYWNEVDRVTRVALKQLDSMRTREGVHLYKDQMKRLQHIQHLTAKIHDLALGRAAQVDAVAKHVKGSSVSHARQALETAAAAADRNDITEELVRFESHCAQYAHLLAAKEPVGRQLDFLLQELHREINTIGSKAGNLRIAQGVVTVKSELEKLREQAQNIE